MASSRGGLSIPDHLEREGLLTDEERLESGLFAVDLLCRTIDRPDLSDVELLDIGGVTRLFKALRDYSLPIGRFIGLDFSYEVVDWLQGHVSDPRFQFHFLDAQNEWLNPGGQPLESFDLLPLGPRRFDLISVFSVFTHLAPDDYVTILRLLRRHAAEGGALVFSLHLIDAAHPSPLEEQLRHKLNSEIPGVRARAAARIEEVLQRVPMTDRDPRFVDEDPDEPLLRAQYTEDYARELVDGTGWEIEAILPPERFIDHCMVCHRSPTQ